MRVPICMEDRSVLMIIVMMLTDMVTKNVLVMVMVTHTVMMITHTGTRTAMLKAKLRALGSAWARLLALTAKDLVVALRPWLRYTQVCPIPALIPASCRHLDSA